MKKTVLVFGGIAGTIITIVNTIIFQVFGTEGAHTESQLVGYLVQFLAFTTIFVAVKQYRDQHLGGVIKFGPAFYFQNKIYLTFLKIILNKMISF